MSSLTTEFFFKNSHQTYIQQAMQFYPQQQYSGLTPQCQQCVLSPGYNNFASGYAQPQQQYLPYGAAYPQQNFSNPYQQQYYYPQQQQQQYYNPQQQQQQYYNPQQQQQQYYYPQQQQQQQYYYPQQQQQQFSPYSQQQWSNWPQSYAGQNAYGNQQYWPRKQHRVHEDSPISSSSSSEHLKKGKQKQYYERYYF